MALEELLKIGHALLGSFDIRACGAAEVNGDLSGVDLRKEFLANAEIQGQRSSEEQPNAAKYHGAMVQRASQKPRVVAVQSLQQLFDRSVKTASPARGSVFVAGMRMASQPLGAQGRHESSGQDKGGKHGEADCQRQRA